MANEIKVDYASGSTLYAVIRNDACQVWYIVGQVFEVWGGGAGRDMDDYDIALVDKTGSRYVGDFDNNVAAGRYSVQIFLRAGAAPVDGDSAIAVAEIIWSGSAEEYIAKVGDAMTLADSAISQAKLADDIGSTAYATNKIALAVFKSLEYIDLDHLMAFACSGNDIAHAVADNSVLALILTDDGVIQEYHKVDDSLEAIRDKINLLSAATVTALLAKTGITAGGTWSYSKIIKVLVAVLAGKIQTKSGSSSVYEILDPDDGATVIAELTPSATTPFRSVSIS